MSLNTILATAPLTTTNYILKATGTTIGNSLIWDNGTNVGIGNTNTSYTLDVTGTGRFTGALIAGATTLNGNLDIASGYFINMDWTNDTRTVWERYNSATYFQRISSNAPSRQLRIESNGAYGNASIVLDGQSNTTVTTSITSDITYVSGKLGIGTNTPNGPLDIVGPLYGGLYTLSLYDSAAVAADIGGGIYFGGNYTGTTKTGWAGILGRKDNATDGQYGGYMAFLTRTNGSAPAERMRISSGGQVGIGTTSWSQPYTKLIVAGAIAYNNNGDDAVSDNSYGQSFAKKIDVVGNSGANTIYSAAGSEGAFYVITGLNLTTGARFVDLVLYLGAASTTPVVVSSQTYLSPGGRTYANSGENLTLSITGNSNTYTIRMTGMGANERT